MTLPPTFPLTPVSPLHAPRLDMKYHQSTLGLPPITPISPLPSFPFEKSAAHPTCVENDDNHERGLANWQGDPTGTLPTPVSPLKDDTGR